MGKYLEAFDMLKGSIVSNDIVILFVAIATVVFFLLTVSMARSIKKRTKEWKKKKNSPFTRFLCKNLSRQYTLYTTMITIFPLLGMLGTVCGLLGLKLDVSGVDGMTNIKNNFFLALTSTAWGIIFSVIFKVALAFIQDYVEEQIEVAKKLMDETE